MSRRKRIFRIFLHLGLILLWCVVVYVGIGSPSFSPEMAMHRAEAAEWIGPSRVIGNHTADGKGLLVGETDYGYCFYEYTDEFLKWDRGQLLYVSGDESRICFMQDHLYYGTKDVVLPVYSICTVPEAAMARLTLISDVNYEAEYTVTHTAEAVLQDGIYFLFEVDMSGENDLVPQAWNLWLMRYTLSGRNVRGTLRVEYFDRDGNLIETVSRTYPETP